MSIEESFSSKLYLFQGSQAQKLVGSLSMLLYHQIYRYGAPRVRKERSGDSSFRVKRLLSEWRVESGE